MDQKNSSLNFLFVVLNIIFWIFFMADKLTLGYWGIGGLAQPLRYILAYSKLDFENKVYSNRDDWFLKDKIQLGLKFPNIPYLIDGNIKLTESSAILRYLPKRIEQPSLLGKTIEDQALVDTFLGVIDDIWSTYIATARTNPDWAVQKPLLYQKLRPRFQNLQKNACEDWLIGYLTIVDFKLAEFIGFFQSIWPEHFENFPRLKKSRNNLYAIPEIEQYRKNNPHNFLPATLLPK